MLRDNNIASNKHKANIPNKGQPYNKLTFIQAHKQTKKYHMIYKQTHEYAITTHEQ